jgi:hypothetical protein
VGAEGKPQRREAGAGEKLELRQSGDGGGTGTDPGGLDDMMEAGAGAGDGACNMETELDYDGMLAVDRSLGPLCKVGLEALHIIY